MACATFEQLDLCVTVWFATGDTLINLDGDVARDLPYGLDYQHFKIKFDKKRGIKSPLDGKYIIGTFSTATVGLLAFTI